MQISFSGRRRVSFFYFVRRSDLLHRGSGRAAPQCVLKGREEGRVLQGAAHGPDQVPVLPEAGALGAERPAGSNGAAEVEGGGVFQELPSEQVLLEATGGGASQRLQSPAHRGEEAVQDLHQERQEGGGLRPCR